MLTLVAVFQSFHEIVPVVHVQPDIFEHLFKGLLWRSRAAQCPEDIDQDLEVVHFDHAVAVDVLRFAARDGRVPEAQQHVDEVQHVNDVVAVDVGRADGWPRDGESDCAVCQQFNRRGADRQRREGRIGPVEYVGDP